MEVPVAAAASSASRRKSTTMTPSEKEKEPPVAIAGELQRNTRETPSTPTKPSPLPILIERVKSLLTLSRYNPNQFKTEHTALVTEFLTSKKIKKMLCFIDESGQLFIQENLPGFALQEMAYFIRDTNGDDLIDEDEFETRIQYGTVDGAILDSLLRMMGNVYMPLFFENKDWPDTVRKDFSNQLHKLMAFLTDTSHQIRGSTVLYIPTEDLSDVVQVVKSKEVVQRLESLVIHWTRQIKEVVNNLTESAENSGPLEEIEFWKMRCNDLSGISAQLKQTEVLNIIKVLTVTKSSYLEQFLRMANMIQDGSIQAHDNLRFLSLLSDPCNELANAEPKQIPNYLPRILHCVRIIWTHSQHYNTKDRLTSLLRKVSNEVIRRCTSIISLEEIFYGDVEASMQRLNESIECGEAWKSIYKVNCNQVQVRTGKTWDFDQSSIFAQIDAFVQRCRDLIEVCEGQVQFARKHVGGKKSPIPFFGGTRGPAIMKSLEDIEIAYEKQLQTLWNIRKHILNVKATNWHDEFHVFKQGVKDLELMMQNVISSAFETAMTVESQLELLEIFHFLARRDAIKRTVEKKTADTYLLFIQELNAVKVEFEAKRKTPEILRFHPDYSGSAYWAKNLLKRIKHSMELLQEAYYLPQTHLAEEAKMQFEPLSSALEDFIMKTYHEWVANLPQAPLSKLECALMSKSRTGSLEMKFDRDLARLFPEIFYWQKMKYDIPFAAQEINTKKEELRVLRENVSLVIRDYNAILETLSAEEANLFRERIRFLDRKIKPGMTNLTWASKGITEYFVRECRKHSHDVQKIVSEFADSYVSLQKNCNLIANTLLCHIESKKIYELDEFQQLQTKHLSLTHQKVAQYHSNIQAILNTMHEFFLADGKEVQQHWVKYVAKIDGFVEDALRTSVKKSLQELSKAINGEGRARDGEVHPLFRVNVILDNQKIEFSPNLTNLETSMNDIAKSVISSATTISRLVGSVDACENAAAVYDSISQEDDILKIFVSIQNGMSANAVKCQAYVRNWDSYREIWEINKDAFIRRYAKLKPALSTFDADINRYSEVANNTQKEETYTNVNFIRLDCSPLKHALVSHCNVWQNKLTTLLNSNAATELNELHAMFTSKSAQLQTVPSAIDELSETLTLLSQLQADLPNIQARFTPLNEQYQILEKYEVSVKEEEKTMLATLTDRWTAFVEVIHQAEKTIMDYKAKFKADLINSVDEFNRSVVLTKDDFLSKGPFSESFTSEKAFQLVEDYRVTVQNLASQERQLRKGLAVFKIEQSPSKDIEQMASDIELLMQIWQLYAEWDGTWNKFKILLFSHANINEIKEAVQRFDKRLQKYGKEAKDWDVFVKLKDRVVQFQKCLPVIEHLQNKALRPRHWSKLVDEIGKNTLTNESAFTIQNIISHGLEQYGEIIASLSSAATQELTIEIGLETIQHNWDKFDFDLESAKGGRIMRIRQTDKIFELLEDNQSTLVTMKGSKFYSSFEKPIAFWEKNLTNIGENVEYLIHAQEMWAYLESIFVGAEDIRKQLPRESSLFDYINKTWSQVVKGISTDRNVFRASLKEGLYDILEDIIKKAERVQKSLDSYLETKRYAFPRFHFLSNDDMLQLISQSRDPHSIQVYLRKCFDNLTRLEVKDAGFEGHKHFEATGMYSADGEYIPFVKPLPLEGPVEHYLAEVEMMMKVTLKMLLSGCINAQKKQRRDKMIKEWPGQLLVLSGQILWTGECTKSLAETDKGDERSLKHLRKKQILFIRKLAELTKSPLSEIERRRLIALITVEVHSRDVIEHLIKADVTKVDAFNWMSQMRFYYDKDKDLCNIRQMNTEVSYGYEYIGNSGRLVLTPLTDRCFLTLTTALSFCRGGCLQGPAGTGKTETVRDLGKTLGKFVVVQNCSESSDVRSITRTFAGLTQTGSWGCFDEFNRIDEDVLTVVAMEISTILNAVSRKANTFVFEGREIKLDPTCAIFTTMNASYAGRHNLPDSLKLLLRPISMIIPDSVLISEVTLFAEGFENSRVLARKLDTLFKLLSQQLSKQPHYDFALRSLTATLGVAGLKKKQDPTASDEMAILSALKDTITPRLIDSDIEIFNAILSDLFPGVEIIPTNMQSFLDTAKTEMKDLNLEPTDSFLQKITEFYLTKSVRHSVMLVGQTGSGKTACWKLVEKVQAKINSGTISAVNTTVLNPKMFTIGELYGEYNREVNEWRDGVFAAILRNTVANDDKENWIILDSPVDSYWIESANSLLDANKTLTLTNGERIIMKEKTVIIVETDSLLNASPATVSRCGIIYMSSETIGWQTIVNSWVKKHSDQKDLLSSLVEKYLPRLINFRRTCSSTVTLTEFNLLQTFFKLFDAFITSKDAFDQEDPDSKPKVTEMWFLLALIWSIGGGLEDVSRRKFDMFLREIEGQFPSKDTVYDYCVDKNKKIWQSWSETVPSNWRFSPYLEYQKILVPTADAMRASFLFEALIQAKLPIVVTGESGIGKSVIVQNLLNANNFASSVTVHMSRSINPKKLQGTIEARLEKRAKGVFGPVEGNLILFVDDLQNSERDPSGSHAVHEFLRFWSDSGCFLEDDKATPKLIQDVSVVAAMTVSPHVDSYHSSRLFSRFAVIHMPTLTETSIRSIYQTMVSQKFQEFEEEVKPLCEKMVASTYEVFTSAIANLLPSPIKPHYLFTFRDIHRVFQGIMRSSKEYYDSKDSIARLWVHEIYRVFSDRLIDDEDRQWLSATVEQKLVRHFDMKFDEIFPNNRLSFFGDFNTESNENTTTVYQELDDEIVKKYFSSKLASLKSDGKHGQMNLVFFREALDHLCRIIRVVRLPRGHLSLFGVRGSGRYSLALLAAHVLGYDLLKFGQQANYSRNDFHEDLKKAMTKTVTASRSCIMFVSEENVKSTWLMENIHAVLAEDEIDFLFTDEDLQSFAPKFKPLPNEQKLMEQGETLLSVMKSRMLQNIHVIFSFTSGENLRNILRNYPSILYHTTINWFSEWPNDALMEVSMNKLQMSITSTNFPAISISKAFVDVHNSVIENAKQLQKETRKALCVTPTVFLELVSNFCKLLKEKSIELEATVTKLRNGLKKLDDTRETVERISVELEMTKKQMMLYQRQCEEYLVIIVQQKRDADEQAKGVASREEKLLEEEREVKAIADAAEADLAQALPAFDSATKALESLSKKDIQEVKSYGKCPPLVEKVIEAVMVLKKCEPTWEEGRKQLGNPNFIKQLINLDKDNISDKILKRISQYCSDEQFQPEVVGRVSIAAKSLCMWVRAVESYAVISRQLAPKREKVQAARENLEKKQAVLKEAQSKLAGLRDKLTDLTKQYDEKVELKEQLKNQIIETETKLNRAQQLVQGLSGERLRWEESIKLHETSIRCLPGDCVLAASFLTYLGPFNSKFRSAMVAGQWLEYLKACEISCTNNFSPVKFLEKESVMRDWCLQGLPSDNFSIENAIIIQRGERYPIIADPQSQASKWLKNRGDANLTVIKMTDPHFHRILENAIRQGFTALIEDVQEPFDHIIENLLTKTIKITDKGQVIRLGEKEVEFNSNFKCYLLSRQANPNFSMNVLSKAGLITFSVKEKGFEDQLLGHLIRREKPDLEQQKQYLMTHISKSRKTLQDLENQILDMLNSAQGSLLDDEKLVNALSSSKHTAQEVAEKLKISEENEARIDAVREGYRPCAERAALIYLALNDLSVVSPIYQFSLENYIDLFNRSIAKSKKSDDLSERLAYLMEYHTNAVYRYACRGLFESHRLLFSFLLTAKIISASGKLNASEFDFLLSCGYVPNRDAQPPNTCSDWITDSAWDGLTELDNVPGFSTIASSIGQSEREWKLWFFSAEPENLTFPGEWENKLNDFQKMLIIRCLRPDRITQCICKFVITNLGQPYVEPVDVDLGEVWNESSPTTPIFIAYTSGVDAFKNVRNLAEKHGFTERLKHVSLGQGQIPKAVRTIQEGVRDGEWIYLDSCHLSMNWLSQLEKIIADFSNPVNPPHPNFRLWISMHPVPNIPLNILQNSIHVSYELSQGLKANLLRLVEAVKDEEFDQSPKPEPVRRLFYALSIYHGLLVERNKFSSLGWNFSYDFNDSDFDISRSLTSSLVCNYDMFPWDALKYIVAEINYGGRVTDEWDRRVLRTYANELFNQNVIDVPGYKFCSDPIYVVPEATTIGLYRDYLTGLPVPDKPEAFGQHVNGYISAKMRHAVNLLGLLASLQPEVGADAFGKRALSAATDILTNLPESIDMPPPNASITYRDVLQREVEIYRDMLKQVRDDLLNVQRAIKGTIVLTADLEAVLVKLNEGAVPTSWTRYYPTSKSLASWTREFMQRIEFFSEWVKGSDPKSYWLGAFTFPGGFLTGILQKASRKMSVPFDHLSWEITPLGPDEDVTTPNGVVIRGLLLEGASWDRKLQCLKEPKPMELLVPMPTMLFRPVEGRRKGNRQNYQCPVYYSSLRTNTGDDRTSYIMTVDLKTGGQDPEFWIKRGAALLCS